MGENLRRRKKQWRLRRKGGLKEPDKKRHAELSTEQERVEKMIRRFACRHDARCIPVETSRPRSPQAEQ